MKPLRLPLVLALVSCADNLSADAPFAPAREEIGTERGADGGGGEAPMAEPASPAPPAARSMAAMAEKEAPAPRDDEGEKAKKAAPDEPAGHAARSWFPESFLWVPLVQTDAAGTARVELTVPDSLTTWQVLGLAWSPGGAQAGDTLSVLSTKDAYVDVVVPGALLSGDEVQLPVQVVNTTGQALSGPLDVQVAGGAGAAAGALTVGPGGTVTRTVAVSAGRAGTLRVTASFGQVDAVERSVPVRPAGRPIEARGSGAVGGAASAIPAGQAGPDGELVIQVWAGAESVIAEELNGGGVRPLEDRLLPPGWALADHAYDFALAQAAGALPADVVDPEAARTRRIRAWQPLVRAGRAPDAVTACLLADALHGAPADSPEGLLLDRMMDQVRAGQAPDGSWSTGAATIDGELVQAATCARAAGDDAAVRLRAEGFFTRNRPRLEDPYLAAQALASGAVQDAPLADALRATLKAALVRDADGAWLDGGGNLRADGSRVTREEATAAAALALADDAEARSALATALLSARRPWGGWGDGRTNLLVLRALAQVFDPQTGAAQLSVSLDGGAPLATGTLAAGGARSLTLRVPWSGAASSLQVSAPSPTPGLVYSWRSRSYGAWQAQAVAGTELSVRAPAAARVGEVAKLAVQVATPSADRATVGIGLPAGVRPDPAGMEALVAQGAFAGWEAAEGSVVLREVAAGGWSGEVPVLPALAGRLGSGPSQVYVGAQAGALVPPTVWTIGG